MRGMQLQAMVQGAVIVWEVAAGCAIVAQGMAPGCAAGRVGGVAHGIVREMPWHSAGNAFGSGCGAGHMDGLGAWPRDMAWGGGHGA